MEYTSFIRLNEMHEEIIKSIENIKKIIEQQKLLMSIVSSSESAETFKEFLEHINEATSQYEKQVNDLEDKKELLEDVIQELSSSELNKQLADKIFSILGIK